MTSIEFTHGEVLASGVMYKIAREFPKIIKRLPHAVRSELDKIIAEDVDRLISDLERQDK